MTLFATCCCFLLFAVVYVSAWTMTIEQYEDASCTQLTPLSQCIGWTANPFTVNSGECKNWVEFYSQKTGYEPTGDCASPTFKANMYTQGCGGISQPVPFPNGGCYGGDGVYIKYSCN